jgi:hypothetical protein
MKGETILIINSVLFTALLIMSILCLRKVNERKENYTVDITGGFKNLNCGCEGDCILNYRDNPVQL